MTKPVALADKTYERLRQRRRPGESFSQAIDRLILDQRKDPLTFVEKVPRSRRAGRDRIREIEADRNASYEQA